MYVIVLRDKVVKYLTQKNKKEQALKFGEDACQVNFALRKYLIAWKMCLESGVNGVTRCARECLSLTKCQRRSETDPFQGCLALPVPIVDYRGPITRHIDSAVLNVICTKTFFTGRACESARVRSRYFLISGWHSAG